MRARSFPDRAVDYLMDQVVGLPTLWAKKTERKSLRLLCLLIQFLWFYPIMAILLPFLLVLGIWDLTIDYIEDP
jgi:hypothetical protein